MFIDTLILQFPFHIFKKIKMVKPNKGDFKFSLCEREWLAVGTNW